MNPPTNDEPAVWVRKARQRMEDAKLLYEHDSYESAANRLYYAALAAVTAILVSKDNPPSSHSAAQRLFGLHVVKPGLVGRSHAEHFKLLSKLREEADYDGLPLIGKSELAPLTTRTEQSVDTVLGLLDRD